MNADDVIRRVLEAEASTVEVRPDALGTIRDRIGARRRRNRAWIPGALAAAATVAAVAVGLATCAPPPTPDPPTPPPAATPPAATLLPVYYTGPGDRLYREFHGLDAGAGAPADRVRAAVTEMLAASAYDPEYRTAWPAGTTVRGVTVDGDTVSVDLTAEPPDDLARQQLVWTATAASGLPEVRLLLDGRPAGEPVRRGPALDVLAPVWLVEPQAGTVGRPQLAVHVYAVAPDATVGLRVRQGERIVYEGTVTLDKTAPERGEGRATVPDLRPGEYTVEAYTADGSDAHDVSVR
jgi:hypothetical protein